MPNVTNTLTCNITSTNDTDGTVPINRGTGNPAFDSSAAEFTTYKALPIGDTSLQLPKSPCCQVYVKNLDSSKVIIVTGTLNGSANSTITKLNPGDQVSIWLNPVGTLPGYTDITLNASAAGALVEFFLGG